jgi:hypothetical protein
MAASIEAVRCGVNVDLIDVHGELESYQHLSRHASRPLVELSSVGCNANEIIRAVMFVTDTLGLHQRIGTGIETPILNATATPRTLQALSSLPGSEIFAPLLGTLKRLSPMYFRFLANTEAQTLLRGEQGRVVGVQTTTALGSLSINSNMFADAIVIACKPKPSLWPGNSTHAFAPLRALATVLHTNNKTNESSNPVSSVSTDCNPSEGSSTQSQTSLAQCHLEVLPGLFLISSGQINRGGVEITPSPLASIASGLHLAEVRFRVMP